MDEKMACSNDAAMRNTDWDDGVVWDGESQDRRGEWRTGRERLDAGARGSSGSESIHDSEEILAGSDATVAIFMWRKAS